MTKNSDITGSEFYHKRTSIYERRIYLENRLHRDTNQLVEFINITEKPYSSQQLLVIKHHLLEISNVAVELTQIHRL